MSEIGSTDDTLAGTRGPVETTTDEPRGRSPGRVLSQGAIVGRYVVLSKLGAGGMGVVYAAYDPELDRKVALKLLLPGRDGREGRSRLLREAHALAKLQHPNVVAIHDVGTHDGQVWLAMEFVEGSTLDAWRTQTPRTWPEVLEVLVLAGRGVAAAHAAGLLHRDLKPDNIMVGADGRVRVMDFGLARPGKEQSAAPSISRQDSANPRLEALELRLTQTGALMGTPAYMAPEQLADERLGPATDQFSFCVTAWEALHGTRPFTGKTVVELSVAVLGGQRTPPPQTTVPTWLRRVLDRGLAVEPATRWPSMDALLDALGRGRKTARWRRGLALAALLAGCAAAFAGWQEIERRNRIAACDAAGASIAEVWNDEFRESLHEALVGTGVSYAKVTADKVMPWLDAFAEGWQVARIEACLDVDVRDIWDQELYDRALWCLDERRMGFEALVDELSRAGSGSVVRAVDAAAQLDRLDRCRDADILLRLPSVPEGQREEIRAVRAELTRVIALERTGSYEEGLGVARNALGHAEGLAWPPLVAIARHRVGQLLYSTGAYAAAEEALESAYFEAMAAGALETALAAADQLALAVGDRLARHPEGFRWSRHAEVTLAVLPDVGQEKLAYHLDALAGIHKSAGSDEKARALYERVLAICEQAFGPEHPHVGSALNNLATVHESVGDYATARRLHERALVIFEGTFGPDHPIVAVGLDNLGVIHHHTGSYDQAKALHERAVALRERALGPDHPDLALSLANLASLLEVMGAHEEAKALHERALAIFEKTLGPDHPDVAAILYNLALVQFTTGAYDEAKALHERAHAIFEKALGPDHARFAANLGGLAAVSMAMGSHGDAKALYERALAIQEEALGPDHPTLARQLLGLANVALAQGRAEDAVAPAERAVLLWVDSGVAPNEVALARFVLAQALWAAKRDRPRALALAEQAREAYRESGDVGTQGLAEVQAWFLEHDRANGRLGARPR
jgi:eukaryotic-like serine/threonine-protein kinase